MSLTKTLQTALFAPTAVAAGAEAVSSAVDVRAMYAGQFVIDWGYSSTTAPTVSGTEIWIEGSENGTTLWRSLVPMTAPLAAATTCTLRTPDKTLGQTVIECNTVVPALGSIVLIKPASASASEFHRVTARSTTSGSETFTIPSPGLAAAIAFTGTNVYTGAVSFNIMLDLLSIRYVRVRVNNNAGSVNSDGVIRAALITTDSIS